MVTASKAMGMVGGQCGVEAALRRHRPWHGHLGDDLTRAARPCHKSHAAIRGTCLEEAKNKDLRQKLIRLCEVRGRIPDPGSGGGPGKADCVASWRAQLQGEVSQSHRGLSAGDALLLGPRPHQRLWKLQEEANGRPRAMGVAP